MNMQTVFSDENYHDINGVDLCPEFRVLQQTVSGTLQALQF